MKKLFVDTSGWYELLLPGSRLSEDLATVVCTPDHRFVTSTHVLHELVALMLRRHNHSAASRAGAYLRSSPEIRIEHPDTAEEAEAWRLFLSRPDKDYSLTDCSSFCIMRRLSITEAITTDAHFSQEGFTVLV